MNNKTVIISCAGMGKRLGMNMPKALVEVEGKPMIIRTLEMLDNINDIRIVVGYQAEKVIEVVNQYRKDITFVFNHNYMNNGTGASVSLAMQHAKEYILTIDGDLLIHPNDMEELLNCEYEFVGVCNPSTDNPVLTSIHDDKVVEFSREKGTYEWTGVCLIKNERLLPSDGHVYQLIEPLLPLNYKIIRVREIDTPNDYHNAVKWVKNNFSDNVTIGIVGGMGSIATTHFFDKLIKSFKVKKEWDRPRIIVDNRCNMPSRVRAILYNERRNELVKTLSESIMMLIENNCDYIVLACNTSHVFLDEVYNCIPECKGKIINIIDECAKKLKKDNIKKVKLLASEGTIESNIYYNILNKYDIDIIYPNKNDYSMIREWIESVKQDNITDEIKNKFVKHINLDEEKNIILGCTELPVLYQKCENEIKKNIYDPLQIVIEMLVDIHNKNNFK